MSKKWVFVFTMAAIAAMMVGVGSGFAASTWTGATNTLWSEGGNWTGGVPTNGVTVFFDNTSLANLATVCDLAVTTITIQVDDPPAAVSIEATAALTISGITNNSPTYDLTLTGSLAIPAATSIIVGTAARKVTISDLGGAGVINKSGAGTLITAGTISYDGATNVNAGTLLVNGTQATTGEYTVFSGATLGGTGTTASAITISDGGFMNPGNTGGGVGPFNCSGAFTFSANSNYIVDISGASCDLLNLTGGAFTNSGNIDLGAGEASALAQPYTVVTSSAGSDDFTNNYTGWTDISAGNDIILQGVAGVPGAVPTLTEWGLILFALFITVFAIQSIRKKNYMAT